MSYPPGNPEPGAAPNMPPNTASMPVPPVNYGGGYGYAVNPLDTLLTPARRAGITMFVGALLTLLLGGLLLILAVAVGSPELQKSAEFQQAMRDVNASAGSGANVSPRMIQIMATIFAAGLLLYAIASSALAFFVRRGGKGAVVTALVGTSVVLLLAGVYFLAVLLTVQIGGICAVGIALIVLILQLVFLIQATAKTGQVAQWRQYLSGQGWSAQWPHQGGYPPAPAYTYPGANPYAFPPAPPAQTPPQPPPPQQ